MRRRRAKVAGAVALMSLVAAAGLTWNHWLPRGSSEVSVREAADRARDSSSGPDADADPGLRPAPGVYVFKRAATSTEHVHVLGSQRVALARQIPATVTLRSGCNWTLRLDFTASHSTTYGLCTTADGVQLRTWDETISLLGQEGGFEFACRDAPVWHVSAPVEAAAEAGTTTCLTPLGNSTTRRWRERVVDGSDGPQPQVTVAGTFSKASGSVEERWTFREDGLPTDLHFASDTTSDIFLLGLRIEHDSSWRLESDQPVDAAP